jgi:hypothetical protein
MAYAILGDHMSSNSRTSTDFSKGIALTDDETQNLFIKMILHHYSEPFYGYLSDQTEFNDDDLQELARIPFLENVLYALEHGLGTKLGVDPAVFEIAIAKAINSTFFGSTALVQNRLMDRMLAKSIVKWSFANNLRVAKGDTQVEVVRAQDLLWANHKSWYDLSLQYPRQEWGQKTEEDQPED